MNQKQCECGWPFPQFISMFVNYNLMPEGAATFYEVEFSCGGCGKVIIWKSDPLDPGASEKTSWDHAAVV